MHRKITLKRLSASDLTLFEHHYRNTTGAKQKAINLDGEIFVHQLFPGLQSRIGSEDGRVRVSLVIWGPGGAGSHSITRKILKQQKNWRLNGELISSPPEEPYRYTPLAKNDFAILDFDGDTEPHTVRMYLVAAALPVDAALHNALRTAYDASFSQHRGMIRVDLDHLAEQLNSLSLREGHPVLDFIDFETLEDAALGGAESIRKLRQRRQARGISREELGEARRNAERIGRLGEELLNTWFEKDAQDESGRTYRWESDTNAVAPYDFSVIEGGQESRRIDAKSTSGDFRNPIHISMAELHEMARGPVPYDLYRLYSVTESTARLRIAFDVRNLASRILDRIGGLPEGVTVDSISIRPDSIAFGDETLIEVSDDDFSAEQDNPGSD